MANGGMCLHNTKTRSLTPLLSSNYTNPLAIRLQEVIALLPRGGRRIDCDPEGTNNLNGTISSDGSHATINFFSFFGAKNGTSDISINNGKLHWKVTKNPDGDFFYGPFDVYLTRDSKASGLRQVTASRAYLYAEPSIKDKSKSYIIKGDAVELLKISDDLKFWMIRYTAKDGKSIERWIECGTVNACP
ncbi:hypothetical protein BGLA2_700043 [Burkholderia gladioli]|nr:hypothetical protein BGLA2_700043 [Burkholderia gladioli]